VAAGGRLRPNYPGCSFSTRPRHTPGGLGVRNRRLTTVSLRPYDRSGTRNMDHDHLMRSDNLRARIQ
jgi:hypothetical protein